MKNLKQMTLMLATCIVAAVTGSAEELAAFKVFDSNRPFVFNLRIPSFSRSTNGAPSGIEGLHTVMAKGFKTTQSGGLITITFTNALVCHAHRIKGEEAATSVMLLGEMSIVYPAGTSVLVAGRSMRLADLSDKTFEPPTNFNEVYEGDAAIKKLRELGLEPNGPEREK